MVQKLGFQTCRLTCYSMSSIKHYSRHHHFYIGADNFSNIWGNRLLSMKIDYMLLDYQMPLSSLSVLTWIAYRLYQYADPLKLCVFASKLSHQRPPKLQSVHKFHSKGCPDFFYCKHGIIRVLINLVFLSSWSGTHELAYFLEYLCQIIRIFSEYCDGASSHILLIRLFNYKKTISNVNLVSLAFLTYCVLGFLNWAFFA